MKLFGTTSGSGRLSELKRQGTNKNKGGANAHYKKLNIAAKKIASKNFPEALEDIQTVIAHHMKLIPDELGGTEGLSCEIIQSQHSLITESHADQDQSKCIAIWSVKGGRKMKPDGAYFVLPHLTCTIEGKQYSGVAIPIKHGLAVEWEGRSIFHCFTSPTDEKVNIYGTFFGITSM
jgi:hypothetical protein